MEKRKPHYDLSMVQSAIRLRGADAFTAMALIGAQAMGLEIAQAIEVVCSMSRSDFYKSMTTHASNQMPAGIAYVKVILRQDGSIVIQFKEK